ncbi:hypothetical protein FBQ87_17040 [Sphingobacteriales bacterium CHB3]|nr:hypothetical protein [Sphingobacteriales bacterium CHB3]
MSLSPRRAVIHSAANKDRDVVVRSRYKLCPHCGNFSEFSAEHIFCIVCGVKLLEECKQCREPIIYPTARYCPACGTQLVRNGSDPKPS